MKARSAETVEFSSGSSIFVRVVGSEASGSDADADDSELVGLGVSGLLYCQQKTDARSRKP